MTGLRCALRAEEPNDAEDRGSDQPRKLPVTKQLLHRNAHIFWDTHSKDKVPARMNTTIS